MEGYCQLLGGKDALAAQGALLILAVLMLLLKHVRERDRSHDAFSRDMAKQGVGAGCGHCTGLAVASLLGQATESRYQCGWYLVVFTVDTSLGTWATFRILPALSKLCRSQPAGWAVQTFFFSTSVVLARLLCAALLAVSTPLTLPVVKSLCGLFIGRPKLFLSLVMLAGPCCMNLVQYWVQDSWLKKKEQFDKKCEVEPV